MNKNFEVDDNQFDDFPHFELLKDFLNMENAHSQIDQLIDNNTLKDFLIASTQDKYSTLAPQKVYTSGYNKSLEKNILDAYKNMYRKKSIDALQYSQGRNSNLNNLNLKNLPGNIQIGDKIRPQFGGPL